MIEIQSHHSLPSDNAYQAMKQRSARHRGGVIVVVAMLMTFFLLAVSTTAVFFYWNGPRDMSWRPWVLLVMVLLLLVAFLASFGLYRGHNQIRGLMAGLLFAVMAISFVMLISTMQNGKRRGMENNLILNEELYYQDYPNPISGDSPEDQLRRHLHYRMYQELDYGYLRTFMLTVLAGSVAVALLLIVSPSVSQYAKHKRQQRMGIDENHASPRSVATKEESRSGTSVPANVNPEPCPWCDEVVLPNDDDRCPVCDRPI